MGIRQYLPTVSWRDVPRGRIDTIEVPAVHRHRDTTDRAEAAYLREHGAVSIIHDVAHRLSHMGAFTYLFAVEMNPCFDLSDMD